MEHYELRLLADYTHTGVQAANTWARPSPRTVLGELERNERAEVIFAEVVQSPVDGGAEEPLRKIIPVLDGEKFGSYVSLSGALSSVMAPPKRSIWGGNLYSFGTPMSNNPLVLSKAAIPVNGDTWKTLPGGKDQSIPKINPFIRFAYNLLATDGIQGDYQFRYETGNVSDSEENLYFDFNDLNALLVVGLGIRADAPGHLAKTGLSIAGDYHPKGLIPTDYADNPLQFGLTYPFIFNTLPENPFFYAIPKLERPYLIWNEIGFVVVRDDGTAVAVNDLIACITGTRIEMKG